MISQKQPKICSVTSEEDYMAQRRKGRLFRVEPDSNEARWLPFEGVINGNEAFVEQARDEDAILSHRCPLSRIQFPTLTPVVKQRTLHFDPFSSNVRKYALDSDEYRKAKELLINSNRWEEREYRQVLVPIDQGGNQ
jgi:hypothetical protein